MIAIKLVKRSLVCMMYLVSMGIADASNSYVLAVSSTRSTDPSFRDLQFADRDADRFVEAMQQVGFVGDENIVRLRNPKLQDLIRLAEQVQMNPTTVKSSKFVFYFSGHADDRGLHLADGFMNESQLRLAMGALPSQTKIGILDSCFGGGFQSKGFAAVPAFEIPKANFDEPSGSVFITASASGEFAYESRKLKGSVFTDSLVAGLYGDADGNSDGLVTVDELYQHTYSRLSWNGAALPMRPSQSPAIISDLRGKGAVVIAYPSKVDATLRFPAMVSGEISLATSKGLQMYSISKARGSERRVRLPAGDYRFTVLDGWRIGSGQIRLASTGETELKSSQISWTDVESEDSRQKGEDVPDEAAKLTTTETAIQSSTNYGEGRLALEAGSHTGFFGVAHTRSGNFKKLGWYREFFSWRRWSTSYGLEVAVVSSTGDVSEVSWLVLDKEIETKSMLMGANFGLIYQTPWKMIPVRISGEFGLGRAEHSQTYSNKVFQGSNAYGASRLSIVIPYRQSSLAVRTTLSTETMRGKKEGWAKSIGFGLDYKI